MCLPADHAPGLHNVWNPDALATGGSAAVWWCGPFPELQFQGLSSYTLQPSADGKTPTASAAAKWLRTAAGLTIPAARSWLSEVIPVEVIAIVNPLGLGFVTLLPGI